MRDKYDTIERIGDQEDRQGIGVLQFHRCSHLLLDRPVDIQTVCDRARLIAELFRIEVLIAFLVRDEKHVASSAILEFLLHGGDITHRMVCRFLAGA